VSRTTKTFSVAVEILPVWCLADADCSRAVDRRPQS